MIASHFAQDISNHTTKTMNSTVDLNQGEQSKVASETLHVLSDLATPHNNALIDAVRKSGRLRVMTWYAYRTLVDLPWKEGLGGELDNYYFDTWRMRLRLLATLLHRRDDHILLVGYSNLMNKIILQWCAITGRRFMMWTDHPQDRSGFKAWMRTVVYIFVKRADPLFVVGEHTKQWFEGKGFPSQRIVNLPIFIEIPDDARAFSIPKALVRKQYNIPADCVFAVAASRLFPAKGYDLLVQAVALLKPAVKEKLRVVIIGSGLESDALRKQIDQSGLQNCMRLEEWLSPDDYINVLASADIFLHPARFDAFGGGPLFAMAYGVPVVGSEGAGAVVERIKHGINGLCYPPENISKLAEHIGKLCGDPVDRERLSHAARETAKQWPPARGAAILITATLHSHG